MALHILTNLKEIHICENREVWDFWFEVTSQKQGNFVYTESEYITYLKIRKSFQHQADDRLIGTVYIPKQKSNFFGNDEMEVFEQEITVVCSAFELVYVLSDLED